VENNYFSHRPSGRLSAQRGRKMVVPAALKEEAVMEEVKDADVDNVEAEEMAVALVMSGNHKILTYLR
jgi:hypothetical protein